MRVDDLHVFAVAAGEGDLARAAGALGIGERAVYNRIRAVERRVGHPLVRREGSTIVTTAVGNRLLPYAQRSMSLAGEGIAVASRQLEDQPVVLVQASSASAVEALLTRALECIPATLRVDPRPPEALVVELQERRADVAIGPILSAPPRISLRTLATEPVAQSSEGVERPLLVAEVRIAFRREDTSSDHVGSILDAATEELLRDHSDEAV